MPLCGKEARRRTGRGGGGGSPPPCRRLFRLLFVPDAQDYMLAACQVWCERYWGVREGFNQRRFENVTSRADVMGLVRQFGKTLPCGNGPTPLRAVGPITRWFELPRCRGPQLSPTPSCLRCRR